MPIRGKLSNYCGVLVLALLAGAGLAAQEKPDAPTPKQTERDEAQLAVAGATQTTTAGTPNAGAAQAQTGVEQDENTKRILGIIPNFQSKDDIPEIQAPLTAREKYVLAYHQTVDFSAHFGNAFQAMLQQASNGQRHYGQGWGAYSQRFGAAEADQVTSAFFIFGFLPHVLHEDPRYFRKRHGSVWSRIRYSASRTVITRTDSGGSTFNTPQVLGQLPQQDRTASGVFQNWGINLAYTGAYNVLKEFYPDFLRIVFHRRPAQPQAVPEPQP